MLRTLGRWGRFVARWVARGVAAAGPAAGGGGGGVVECVRGPAHPAAGMLELWHIREVPNGRGGADLAVRNLGLVWGEPAGRARARADGRPGEYRLTTEAGDDVAAWHVRAPAGRPAAGRR